MKEPVTSVFAFTEMLLGEEMNDNLVKISYI
jgi:hypothetical protein